MTILPEDHAAAPHRRGRVRSLGYRILPGNGFSYLLHLRPREWPVLAGHMLFGLLLSAAAAPVELDWILLLAGGILFVIFLNGGTLAINSAFDSDDGDIGYLDAPPPVPPGLFIFGMGMMVAGGLIAASLLPRAFLFVYIACFVLSILYSVPPFRWKAVAGLDLAVNAVGFGILTALAGWTLGSARFELWSLLILLAFGPLFAALYPLTQLYQVDEDRARGDRTLAILLGTRRSLLFAIGMVATAFLMLLVGVLGAPGMGTLLARIMDAGLMLVPAAGWLGLLLRWLRRYPTMSPAAHKRGMYRALQLWALTNIVVLVAIFT